MLGFYTFAGLGSPQLKLMYSKKATKIDEIFTIDLTLCSKRQIHGEDFVNFCGLLRKYELYKYRSNIFYKLTLFSLQELFNYVEE